MTKTQEHRSMIGQLMVASEYDYIVYGSVRGLVGGYKSVQHARSVLRDDASGASSSGGYSDAQVYCWDDEDGWCVDATDC